MNIEATIELYAGGQGSGPTAPCPQCGPHHINEGDRVTFKDDHTITSVGGGKYKFKPGTTAKVVSVMPKIGNADQMASVLSDQDQKEGKYGNVGYVKVSDLVLHEARNVVSPYSQQTGKVNRKGDYTPAFDKSGKVVAPDPRSIQIKPVQKSQVLMHTTTNDGASLTWVKSPQTSEAEAKNLSEQDHILKGKFKLLTATGVKDTDGQNRVTRVYDTTHTPLESRSVEKGTTVWISSKTSGGKITAITIREQNYAMHSQKTSMAQFEYKNAAAAVGMLKTRYGINTSLKKLRGGG